MDWDNILTLLLTAVVPSGLTYLATKKRCDSNTKEIRISLEKQIEEVKLKHCHEIEKLESEHNHFVEKSELEHQLKQKTKSDNFSSKFAEMFLKGELDIDKINASVPKLKKLERETNKSKNKQTTSNFVKNKK